MNNAGFSIFYKDFTAYAVLPGHIGFQTFVSEKNQLQL